MCGVGRKTKTRFIDEQPIRFLSLRVDKSDLTAVHRRNRSGEQTLDMLIYAPAVKAKGSGEVRAGAVWDVGERCTGTTGFSVIEEAIEHFIKSPVAAHGDDPVVSSIQSFAGKGHCVQDSLRIGKIHLAKDASDTFLPVRPKMTRAPCTGMWVDDEKRFSVCQFGLDPRSKRFVYNTR